MNSNFKGLDLEPKNHLQAFKNLVVLNGKRVLFSVYREKSEGSNTKETRIRVIPETNIFKPSHYSMREDFIQYNQGEGFKASDITHYLTKVRAGYVGHEPLDEQAQRDCISLAEKLKQQIEWLESGHHAKTTASLNDLCTINLTQVWGQLHSEVHAIRDAIFAIWGYHTKLNRASSNEHLDLVDENQSVEERYSTMIGTIAAKLSPMTEQDVQVLSAYQSIRAMQAQGHPDYIDLMNPSWEGGDFPDEMRHDAIRDVINRVNPVSKVA